MNYLKPEMEIIEFMHEYISTTLISKDDNFEGGSQDSSGTIDMSNKIF